MKANVSVELKKRLEFASKNGSVVATDILNELKKDRKEVFGDRCADYFDSVRVVGSCSEYKTLYMKISVCTKDLNSDHFPDKGNPRAPWFKENREKMSIGAFLGLFKNLTDRYTSEDIQYFDSAICVNDKVSYRLSNKMEDFERAYLGTNYYGFGQNHSSLHGSCMRYEDTARNAADFYANFAGAKILIAEDSQNQILGRAIVWNNVCIPNIIESTKVLDRIYFSFEFVRIGIMKYAHEVLDINIRKHRNTYDSKREFFLYPESGYEGLQRWDAFIIVPQIKWHKKGSPYMDTFSWLSRYDGKIVLTNNTYLGTRLVNLDRTGGYGDVENTICPICGQRSRGNLLCSDCAEKTFENTPFGEIFKCKTRIYKGKKYPVSLFKNGKPTEHFSTWIGIQRICNSSFKL